MSLHLLSRLPALILCAGVMALCGTSGCKKADAPKPQADAHDDHAHVHGPHDGELIAIDGGKHHAEFLHDDEKETVTVWLLCHEGKNAVPVAEEAIVIRVKAPGADGKDFKLAAKPLDGETGKCSRFESTEDDLVLLLEDEKAARELVVKIDGKEHVTPFEHFEHHGHAHGTTEEPKPAEGAAKDVAKDPAQPATPN